MADAEDDDADVPECEHAGMSETIARRRRERRMAEGERGLVTDNRSSDGRIVQSLRASRGRSSSRSSSRSRSAHAHPGRGESSGPRRSHRRADVHTLIRVLQFVKPHRCRAQPRDLSLNVIPPNAGRNMDVVSDAKTGALRPHHTT